MLKDVFGFEEHQEKKTTFGLGYKLILTRKKDEAVLDKAAGIDDARFQFILSTGMYPIIHLPFNNKVYFIKKL